MDKNKCSKEINMTKAIRKLSYVKTEHFSCKYDNYFKDHSSRMQTLVFLKYV